jgi:predicted RNA polymerase sigma factor
MAEGAANGLSILDALRSDPALANYHLLPAARGDLLARLGRAEEAGEEFERAAALTKNERERKVLLARAAGSR